MSTDHEGGPRQHDAGPPGESATCEQSVAEGILRMFGEAVAAAKPVEAEIAPAATPAESARLLDEAFMRWEREAGLNVLPFPEWARRREVRPEG